MKGKRASVSWRINYVYFLCLSLLYLIDIFWPFHCLLLLPAFACLHLPEYFSPHTNCTHSVLLQMHNAVQCSFRSALLNFIQIRSTASSSVLLFFPPSSCFCRFPPVNLIHQEDFYINTWWNIKYKCTYVQYSMHRKSILFMFNNNIIKRGCHHHIFDATRNLTTRAGIVLGKKKKKIVVKSNV